MLVTSIGPLKDKLPRPELIPNPQGEPARISFRLDKISRVGMTITDSHGKTMLSTSATVGRGTRYFSWRSPLKAGTYVLRLSARDLVGNPGEPVEGKLKVLKARR